MKPGDPHWHSQVEQPVVLGDSDGEKWDAVADVVIVGLGGAGVCAAIEALDAGASVLAIDRFSGGGATRLSGGVVYAGGGTRYQRKAEVTDDPDSMMRYLGLEVGNAVSEATLRDFCENSVAQLEWLEAHGVPFDSSLCPIKTSYPPDGSYLYYSGNETQADYCRETAPAQRGHRTFGKGLTGRILFDALLSSARNKGLQIRTHALARRLIVSEDGRIEGVEIDQVDPGSRTARALNRLAVKFARSTTLLFPALAERIKKQAADLASRDGRPVRIGARKAVILTAGGYIHNRAMVAHYAPHYAGAIALGSIGCDGSGIRLGQSVGAATAAMDNISAWRQFQPPRALAAGIVVNARGERFVTEDCYGGTIGHAIAEQPGAAAHIIIDSSLRKQALRQALPGRGKLFRLQGAPALMGILTGSKKARSLDELARICGMDPALLTASVEHYNRASAGLEPTAFRKHPDFIGRIVRPPFYAVDISLGNLRYFCPSISLGGIVVDERSGQALDENGRPIPGLYAAGKNARGISSNRYISGISLADCVYSGRIAGRSAVLGASDCQAGSRPSARSDTNASRP